MTRPENFIQQEDILLSEQESGEVRINVGDKASGVGAGSGVAVWGVDGFVGMPNLPSDAGCAVALVYQDGHQQRAVATKDVRFAEKAGALQPGDRAIVSDCGARLLLKQATSSISLFTENEADDGNAILHNLNGQEGSQTITVGATTIRLEKDRIVMCAGGTFLTLDSGGLHIHGKHFDCSTGGGNFGTMGPIPPPQGTNSILAGVAGMAGAPSSKWTVALSFAIVMFVSALLQKG